MFNFVYQCVEQTDVVGSVVGSLLGLYSHRYNNGQNVRILYLWYSVCVADNNALSSFVQHKAS